MPTYVVEIEWPLSGTDAGQNFWPSAVVRDEDDTGLPPPSNTHKVTFSLFHTPNSSTTTAKLPVRDSAPFNAASEPTIEPTAQLTTDATGSHKLVATLFDISGSTPVEVDTDEELNINVTLNGLQRRELSGIIIEE